MDLSTFLVVLSGKNGFYFSDKRSIPSISRPLLVLSFSHFTARETKWQVKWHAKGMRIGKKIPRKYVTDGKENFLACQFTLHLAAHYFYFLEFTCQMAMSCFTGSLWRCIHARCLQESIYHKGSQVLTFFSS